MHVATGYTIVSGNPVFGHVNGKLCMRPKKIIARVSPARHLGKFALSYECSSEDYICCCLCWVRICGVNDPCSIQPDFGAKQRLIGQMRSSSVCRNYPLLQRVRHLFPWNACGFAASSWSGSRGHILDEGTFWTASMIAVVMLRIKEKQR